MKQQIQLRRREAVDGVELPADLPPLLQRLYASRGVRSAQELERSVKGMLPWTQLTGVEKAVEMLHDAFQKGLHIVVVGDFDADGATSTALSVLALRALGYGNVSYLVPNRFEDGYGLPGSGRSGPCSRRADDHDRRQRDLVPCRRRSCPCAGDPGAGDRSPSAGRDAAGGGSYR